MIGVDVFTEALRWLVWIILALAVLAVIAAAVLFEGKQPNSDPDGERLQKAQIALTAAQAKRSALVDLAIAQDELIRAQVEFAEAPRRAVFRPCEKCKHRP